MDLMQFRLEKGHIGAEMRYFLQSELSSLLRNHEMNLKRISELERMARMSEEETEKRERRVRELSAKYKVDLKSSCSPSYAPFDCRNCSTSTIHCSRWTVKSWRRLKNCRMIFSICDSWWRSSWLHSLKLAKSTDYIEWLCPYGCRLAVVVHCTLEVIVYVIPHSIPHSLSAAALWYIGRWISQRSPLTHNH